MQNLKASKTAVGMHDITTSTWRLPEIRGIYLAGGPQNKDSGSLGSILGAPRPSTLNPKPQSLGNYHMTYLDSIIGAALRDWCWSSFAECKKEVQPGRGTRFRVQGLGLRVSLGFTVQALGHTLPYWCFRGKGGGECKDCHRGLQRVEGFVLWSTPNPP